MSEPRCVYCGTVTGLETPEQTRDHVGSESHQAMVRLRLDLDAATYVPKEDDDDWWGDVDG